MSFVGQLWRRLRAQIYDFFIVWFTAEWYRRVLEKLPEGAHVLDVGIGTAAALVAHQELLRRKRLHIVGVDIDAAYIERAQQLVADARLNDLVTVKLESVDDHSGGPYDAIYFSGSFMLLPNPAGTLRHLSRQLHKKGAFYFTQTFQMQRSIVLEYFKPLLAYLTTIDFGKVTYPNTFMEQLESGGLQVDMEEVISKTHGRAAKLIVASMA